MEHIDFADEPASAADSEADIIAGAVLRLIEERYPRAGAEVRAAACARAAGTLAALAEPRAHDGVKALTAIMRQRCDDVRAVTGDGDAA